MKLLTTLLAVLILNIPLWSIVTEATVNQVGYAQQPDNGYINHVTVAQTGGDINVINLNQTSSTKWNQAEAIQSGSGNDAVITQKSDLGSNTLKINQTNGYNKIVLDQDGQNTAKITQDQNNEARITQKNSNFDLFNTVNNTTDANQIGSNNLIAVQQRSNINNIADIDQQGGSNNIVGANEHGEISYQLNGVQNNWLGSNKLSVNQSGGGNSIGLNQGNIVFDNNADITQNGGDHCVIYQQSIFKANNAVVNQTGNDRCSLTMINNTDSGNEFANSALVNQGGNTSCDITMINNTSVYGNNISVAQSANAPSVELTQTR